MVRDRGFDVITKAQATTITQGPEGVVVETSDGGTYHGRTGIVTLPMNVMNTVEFKPPLAAIKREAAEVLEHLLAVRQHRRLRDNWYKAKR